MPKEINEPIAEDTFGQSFPFRLRLRPMNVGSPPGTTYSCT